MWDYTALSACQFDLILELPIERVICQQHVIKIALAAIGAGELPGGISHIAMADICICGRNRVQMNRLDAHISQGKQLVGLGNAILVQIVMSY